MRPVIRRAVPDLPVPDPAVLDEARNQSGTGSGQAEFLSRIEAFHAVEARPPTAPSAWLGYVRIAAFNTERLKNRPAVRTLMDQSDAHAHLLSEVDIGMARSGNAHTIHDLIGTSGEGYLFGVEFVELDLGDVREMRLHASERNVVGFHGDAIVSALRLAEAHLIPLEENGLWFPGRNGAQRRIGGRIALAAKVADAPQPLWLVTVHLESKTDPQDRRAQMRNLLQALETIAPDAACIIGGDFNTKALPRGEEEQNRLLDSPENYEPLFADLKSAGFDWRSANLALPTQRTGRVGKPRPPFGKLDWLVFRGVTASEPQLVPALDEQGQPVSDHDMIAADFRFDQAD